MAAPTLTSQVGSTWNDVSNPPETTGSLSWNSGDRILVIAYTEDNTLTLNTPTATGLTFSALGTAIATSNTCWMHAWQATAGSSGSGTVSATAGIGTGSAMRGLHAFAWGNCTGFVRTNGAGINSTQTVSVTRTQSNSAMVFASADWSASGVSGLAWTPAGQTQVQSSTGGGSSAFAARWGDQGATGTTSYGTTGLSGTTYSKFAVEVLGTTSATASAENAAGTATANNATTVLAGQAEAAAGAAAANNATTLLTSHAEVAPGAAAANDAVVLSVTGSQLAVAAAVANDPVVAVVALAEAATAGAGSYDATADTGAPPPTTESLFTSQVPTGTDHSDGTPGIATATSMVFAAAGEITHVRFYATDTVSGTYTVNVWEATSSDPGGTGTLLASKVMGGSPTPSTWNEVQLDTAVSVTPDTKLYRIGLHSSAGRYVTTGSFAPFVNPAGGLTNGNIWAPHTGDDPVGLGSTGQGTFEVSATSTVYPSQSFSAACYFVDVAFAPVGASETTAAAEQATAGATAGDAQAAVVAFAEVAAAGTVAYDATVQVSGTTTAAAGNAPAAANAFDPVTAVVALAEVAAAGAIAYDAGVETANPPDTESLFTNQVPESLNNNDGAPGIVLATSFTPAVDGLIHGIRFYATSTVGGTYTGALHQVTVEDDPGPGAGTLLGSGVLGDAPTPGEWNVIPLDTPVAVTAGTLYRAAMHNSGGRYVVTAAFFNGPQLVNGNLSAPVNGDAAFGGAIRQGTFEVSATSTIYPNNDFNGSSYFVDVTFEEVAPTDVVALAECATAGATAGDPAAAVTAAPGAATTAADAYGPAFSSGAVTVFAEVATAGAAALFDPGTNVSLTLVSDAPVDATATAYDAGTAVVALAEVATAGAVANQPATQTSGSTVAQAATATVGAAAFDVGAAVVALAEVATAGAAALFDAGTSISVTLVSDTPVDAAAAAYDVGAAVVVFAEVATAGAVAYEPIVQIIEAGTVPAEPALVGAAAYDTSTAVIAFAECATAGADAYPVAVTDVPQTVVFAECAMAGAVAYQPVVAGGPVIVAWISRVTETTVPGRVRRTV
jgi:hypothetical protein